MSIENIYLVEYHAGGGGTSRKKIGEYAPHFYQFETEGGQKLVLKKAVIESCETCMFLPECIFSVGDFDYCHEYVKDNK